MNKPRVFWIIRGTILREGLAPGASWNTGLEEETLKLREVLEISDKEIGTTSEKFVTNAEPLDQSLLREAFEAGVRWAIAKLTGGSK